MVVVISAVAEVAIVAVLAAVTEMAIVEAVETATAVLVMLLSQSITTSGKSGERTRNDQDLKFRC